jgi:hypothetical protein
MIQYKKKIALCKNLYNLTAISCDVTCCEVFDESTLRILVSFWNFSVPAKSSFIYPHYQISVDN